MRATKKPLILITNDDGYSAKGINALIDSVVGLGKIVVFAPDGGRSGMSSAITSTAPIRFERKSVDTHRDVEVYACSGTPVDCVKLAISEVLEQKPDVLLSGINHGSNASICVLYSGTMGAAIEGTIFGVPSIGFSLTNHHPNADFTATMPTIRRMTQRVLDSSLPVGVCLNVNFPHEQPIRGVKVCHQAKGQWIKEFLPSNDGVGKPVYWLTGEFRNDTPNDASSDEWALANGYVSVVPIRVDMTATEVIPLFQSWETLL